ncbi:MAG: hypothetical protein GY865_06875 [candidate division Zixibacteria bacterium]|nr:hypothetical protein [candidate division Zixibacteria bacterium]
MERAKAVEDFKDEFTKTEQTTLNFLGMTQDQYGGWPIDRQNKITKN